MFYLYFSLNRKLRLISLPLVKVTDLTLLHWTVGQYRGQEVMSRDLIIVQVVHIRFNLSGSMLIKAFQKAANDKFLPGLSREKITRNFFLSNVQSLIWPPDPPHYPTVESVDYPVVRVLIQSQAHPHHRQSLPLKDLNVCLNWMTWEEQCSLIMPEYIL